MREVDAAAAEAQSRGRVLVRGSPDGRFPRQRPREEEEDLLAVPPLPDAVVDPERWTLVCLRRWRCKVRIHHGEGFAALVGLRREAADPASHNSLLASLGDNMAEVLVMEKGRAKERGLLRQAREAAALQVAANIGWRRRYVESARNPSDAASRDPGILPPQPGLALSGGGPRGRESIGQGSPPSSAPPAAPREAAPPGLSPRGGRCARELRPPRAGPVAGRRLGAPPRAPGGDSGALPPLRRARGAAPEPTAGVATAGARGEPHPPQRRVVEWPRVRVASPRGGSLSSS